MASASCAPPAGFEDGCGRKIDDAIQAYLGMNKIDKLILPLPYSQLLKIFSLFFVFTVPFVLAPTVGILTPFVTLFLAMGYFGLDQVGAELERPYGKDHNDHEHDHGYTE